MKRKKKILKNKVKAVIWSPKKKKKKLNMRMKKIS